ncbi:helix-turn-helix domain-containing protein [Paenibacillus sp. FSL K6-2524]|uniref:helix-turn-helix domain-containing protein n=1 Tax=Paenibacillus sp. FSL K6-2524 TaxID=2954516 RepID=UPI0030F4C3B6
MNRISIIIKKYLDENHQSIEMFSNACGIGRGALRRIVYGNKMISIEQLDRITDALEMPVGTLYESYCEDCMTCNRGWKWLRPLFLRCDELELYNDLRKISRIIMQNSKFIQGTFEIAESFFDQDKHNSATILFESIVDVDKGSHFERSAISHYRLFQIVLYHNFGSPYVAHRFIPFRARLPEAYALDGLMLLTENFAALERWEDVEKYAEEMHLLAYDIYQSKLKNTKKFRNSLRHPLVYYYGRALLLKSIAYEYQGMYKECMRCIAGYVDLSWFEGLNDEGRNEVERLSLFARGNMLCVQVKMGDQEVIPEYASFLRENPQEIVAGLITMLISANEYHYSIDQTLQLFSIESIESIDFVDIDSSESYYKKFFSRHRFCKFFYHYAEYCFVRGHYQEGIRNILLSLEVAIEMKNNRIMVLCMTWFEKYREHASLEQTEVYDLLCKGVQNNTHEERPESLESFWNFLMSTL